MAKHVEIRLALAVVAPLLEFIGPLLDAENARLPTAPNLQGIDRDLQDSWRNDLISSHESDLRVFGGLFDEDFHATGVIEFPEAECEPIVRACSSVRLRLRSGVLKAIKDEQLEGGEIDFESLTQAQRTGVTAYIFLSSFQEILIRHMEPGIGEG